MSAPNYSNIIITSGNQIDILLSVFVKQGYSQLSSFLSKPLGSLIVLYFVLTGYGIIRGLIDKPLRELANGAVRIGVIYLLAMNWSFFSSYFVDFFTKGVSELSEHMLHLMPVKLPSWAGHDLNGGLQSVLMEVVRVGSWIWKNGGIRNPGPYFIAFIIYTAGCLVIALAFFEIIAAKVLLSVSLVAAPLFVIFTLFEKTRSFFDKWLGNMVGFALTIFFVSIVTGFCLHLIHWALADHYINHAVGFKSVDWLPLVFVSALCVMTIKEVVSLAKSIGGACCTSSGGAMMASFMGGAMGAASAKGATKSLARGALKGAMKFAPSGALAKTAFGAAGKALGKGGQQMKSIQSRLRGNKQ